MPLEYDAAEVLAEIVSELDCLDNIPVSGATMTRARQVLAVNRLKRQGEVWDKVFAQIFRPTHQSKG